MYLKFKKIKKVKLKLENYYQVSRIDHSLHIKDQPWYHGLLPRDVVNQLLVNNGDFLIRVF